MIAVVGAKGYSDTTITDVLTAAKVSRSAFYNCFNSKLECFLAAARMGAIEMHHAVRRAVRAVPTGAPAEEQLRAGIREFFGFLAREPACARVLFVELAAGGPSAARRYDTAVSYLADDTQTWHHAVGGQAERVVYDMLAGALAHIAAARVRSGNTRSLPDLEDEAFQMHVAVLGMT